MPTGFIRGDRATIISARHAGRDLLVDREVFQKTVDYPEEYARGGPVALEEGQVVTVCWDQVQQKSTPELRTRRRRRQGSPRW